MYKVYKMLNVLLCLKIDLANVKRQIKNDLIKETHVMIFDKL